MNDNTEIKLNWGQYWNFTEEEVKTATENVIVIKNKILQLHDKIDKANDFNKPDPEIKKKIREQINRLEMSKECIKYYYKLDINI